MNFRLEFIRLGYPYIKCVYNMGLNLRCYKANLDSLLRF